MKKVAILIAALLCSAGLFAQDGKLPVVKEIVSLETPETTQTPEEIVERMNAEMAKGEVKKKTRRSRRGGGAKAEAAPAAEAPVAEAAPAEEEAPAAE